MLWLTFTPDRWSIFIKNNNFFLENHLTEIGNHKPFESHTKHYILNLKVQNHKTQPTMQETQKTKPNNN